MIEMYGFSNPEIMNQSDPIKAGYLFAETKGGRRPPLVSNSAEV